MSRPFTLRPSAKINLSLVVGARRPDGYHDVETVLQSIALADSLTIAARPGPFALTVVGAELPADRSNLVWRAADVLWRALGREGEPRDARLRLVKRIPAGAGLGGGSADAAAALVGLNRAWSAGLSPHDLGRLAGALGSDVPFFFAGGTVAATGRGDRLQALPDIPPLDVLLIKPSTGVATPDAYRWFDDDGGPRPPGGAAAMSLDVGPPLGSIPVVNNLEEPIARRHPVIREMVGACFQSGARVAAMTGSGSAVFGVFPRSAVAAASRRLARADWTVLRTRTLTRREGLSRLGLC